MKSNHFEILRPGTNSTFQDQGFFNVQHLGITNGGVVDYNLFVLANALLNNKLYSPVIEFCYQGPSLKLINGTCRFVIMGNVNFNIVYNNTLERGKTNQTYFIKKGTIIDILSTVNSNYGYFAVEGGFKLIKKFNSYSTLTTAKIGANEGSKIKNNQKIFFKKNGSKVNSKLKINYDLNNKYIRIIRGPQMNLFLPKIIKKFYKNSFEISNNSNRMGITLLKNKCNATYNYSIPSEGIIKGSIQVPGDGNPIVLLNDHPTIGGFPKIGIVIMSDISKLAQLKIGSSFNFIEISLNEALKIYSDNLKKLNDNIKKIKFL